MHITDPVADMLTRIRNASSAKHDTVDVPASNLKKFLKPRRNIIFVSNGPLIWGLW